MCIYTALEQKKTFLFALVDTQSLILDLNGVDEIDSAGYQLLWLLNREADLQNKVFRIRNCSKVVDEMLHFFDSTELLVRCFVNKTDVINGTSGTAP